MVLFLIGLMLGWASFSPLKRFASAPRKVLVEESWDVNHATRSNYRCSCCDAVVSVTHSCRSTAASRLPVVMNYKAPAPKVIHLDQFRKSRG